MKKGINLFLVVVILSLVMSMDITACDCIWSGPFLKVSKDCPLVALVKIKNYYKSTSVFPMAAEVEILYSLKGDSTIQTAKVWGDNGMLCRPYLSVFQDDSIWVMALYESSGNWGWGSEEKGDYFISICGEYYLDVKQDTVIGHIQNANYTAPKQKMVLSDFLEMAKALLTSVNNQSIKKTNYNLEQNYPNSFNLNANPCIVQDSTLNYFPLNVGNTWSYKSRPVVYYQSLQTNSNYIIVDTLTINDNLYYLQDITRSKDHSPDFCSIDTFRIDDSGRILKRIYGHDIVWFDFTLPDGATYQIDYSFLGHSDSLIQNVQVSRNITTETYAGTFTNCINLFFDIPEVYDEELCYSFSPDIGIVGIYGGWMDEWLLSANIEGKIYSSVPKSEQPLKEFKLKQNYPNPFNPTTIIKYNLNKSTHVILTIYNLSGQHLETLVNGFQTAGEYEINWQAEGLPSGIYFYQLQAEDPSSRNISAGSGQRFSETKKLILQK